jgi:hypothetical protein
MLSCEISRSTLKGKKFRAVIHDSQTGRTRVVHFGAKGYSDYTIHKDADRMKRYTERHRARENWTRSGIYTAGFWAKWILWNKPTLQSSIRDTAQRFRIQIKNNVK